MNRPKLTQDVQPANAKGVTVGCDLTAELCNTAMEIAVVAVSGVGQHDFDADPARQRGTKLVERDLRLGLKDDIIGHIQLRAAGGIIRPLLRQIELLGER